MSRKLRSARAIAAASSSTVSYSTDVMTNRSIFYGWWVVAAFCVTTFISTGIRHAVGPFLKPIVADLNLDRASFSLVIAVSLFLYGVFMPANWELRNFQGAQHQAC